MKNTEKTVTVTSKNKDVYIVTGEYDHPKFLINMVAMGPLKREVTKYIHAALLRELATLAVEACWENVQEEKEYAKGLEND